MSEESNTRANGTHYDFEHSCANCGWSHFNNEPEQPALCPECGAGLGTQNASRRGRVNGQRE